VVIDSEEKGSTTAAVALARSWFIFELIVAVERPQSARPSLIATCD
jgi:hypothetical protein